MKAASTVYWLALTIWVAAAASGGVAAMGVFTTLPNIGIRVGDFDPMLGDDPKEHGRLAGGVVMEPIFAATDYVQCAAAVLVCLALVFQIIMIPGTALRPAGLTRTGCIVIAAALLVYHMCSLAPRMNRNLREYWSAARQVDRAAAAEHKAAFDADHPTAEALSKARLGLLLVAVAASGAACAASRKEQRRDSLQTPELTHAR